MSRRLVIEADGGSRGNPGPAGYGAVVRDADTGEVLAERAEGIGRATNNVAEYRGLIAGLSAATDLPAGSLEVRMDSKLVVEQMSGRWRIKHPDLQPLALQAQRLLRELPPTTFGWIPRERNKHADRLANEAMDSQAGTTSAAGRRSPESASAEERSVTPSWIPPTGGTQTLLLRHGQTEHSLEQRFSGRNDLPLTAAGRGQALAAAQRLGTGTPIAAVLASPLLRARQTAGAVAEVLGLPVAFDDDLMETDFGGWEGLTFTEASGLDPGAIQKWLVSTEVAPPGGESFDQVALRVRRARRRVISTYPGATVLLVTHVTPIKLLLRAALDAPASVLFRIHLDLASLSTVDWFDDGRASVRLVNDISHLSAGEPAGAVAQAGRADG